MRFCIPDIKIAVIGLGYVGLPLALEFAKKYEVVGFDVDKQRILELNRGEDRTHEADANILNSVIDSDLSLMRIRFSSDVVTLANCNVFIVTVPTPINQFKSPELFHLLEASKMLGRIIKQGDMVIYESTVYPGCTEEDCIPVLEKYSGLKLNVDFYCGYSPERISPGDRVHTLTTIKKVTSGSTSEAADFVDHLYSSIITAGTHKAPTIKVAEASKAIENAQRDLNISFVNELALIFDRLGIDTTDVIEAAGTKWNFLKYKPGLVGGHCIGVDPYYLAHKAESVGYYPQVILSGRRVNDNMGMFIANKVIKLMVNRGQIIKGAKILILGFTFKENCPDIRNTRVIDIYSELIDYGVNVDIFDPWADKDEADRKYGVNIKTELSQDGYDALVIAVAHAEFLNINFQEYKNNGTMIFDTKSFINRELVDGRL